MPFSIQLLQTNLVQERLCLLQYFSGAAVAWQVALDSQSITTDVVTRKTQAATEVTLTASVPPVALSVDHRAAAGARLTRAKVVQFHSIVAELVLSPVSRSLFADWPAPQRHAAAQSFELEFLDPTGNLRKLGAVPTFYQLKTSTSLAAYQATLGTNLSAPATLSAFNDYAAEADQFQQSFCHRLDCRSGGTFGRPGLRRSERQRTSLPPCFEPQPGTRSTSAALCSRCCRLSSQLPRLPPHDFRRSAGSVVGTAPNDYDTYIATLTKRFHQDFTTTDSTSVPVNQLLIPIVTSILTSATGANYGFGLAILPAQGATQSNSSYLAQLLALSAISIQEFSLRYRLDLTRSDAETSSPVQLNIDTLQGFYSDGFQSSADPLPIFPTALLGRAPFYLEYEEWLTQNGPFYGENYYQITDTVYAEFSAQDVTYFSAAKSDAGADGYDKWLGRFIDLQTAISNGQTQLGLGEYTRTPTSICRRRKLPKRPSKRQSSRLAPLHGPLRKMGR